MGFKEENRTRKRILITCTDSMMKQFLEPHVIHLAESGYEIELACSEVLNRMAEVREDLRDYAVIHQVDLQRSPLAFSNLKGYGELKALIGKGKYDLIWTNEPVMGVMTRLAARKARKQGTKVLYMVHGFHFYRGAPFINWLLFYPVESMMASKSDMICTINREDYKRAQKMNVSQTAYIHGIGVDTRRLQPSEIPINLRKELGLPDEAFLVLSVGELNQNKNQQVIIKAISELGDPDIHYVLCGKGDQRDKLESLAEKSGVKRQVHFLGYRKDVPDIYRQCDVFAMPSKREGLGLAALEAMYCGLPLVNSNIRGLTDITQNGVSGFTGEPNKVSVYSDGIIKLRNNPQLREKISNRNQAAAKDFCTENSLQEVRKMVKVLLEERAE